MPSSREEQCEVALNSSCKTPTDLATSTRSRTVHPSTWASCGRARRTLRWWRGRGSTSCGCTYSEGRTKVKDEQSCVIIHVTHTRRSRDQINIRLKTINTIMLHVHSQFSKFYATFQYWIQNIGNFRVHDCRML